MKSSEFINEGVDKTVNDVKTNHPEIYDFFRQVGAWMTFDRGAKVDSYDTDHSHVVQIKMGPTAGMSNIRLNLESAGIRYESMANPMGVGEVLSGNEDNMYWSVKDDDRTGNITATWLFTFPREEVVDEGDVTTGDFGAKGGPKPQVQNAKQISLAQAFGSEAYNVLANAGVKLHEKPSYWSDLDRTKMGEHGLKRIETILADEGIELEEYAGWEIFSINPDSSSSYVKGPMQRVENMPDPKVFIIYDLPYSDERRGVEEPQIGTFLVDRTGASSYIRFWRQID